jgi:ferritin
MGSAALVCLLGSANAFSAASRRASAPPIQMRAQRFAAWHPDCEAALNSQIAVETAASFQYLAMYAYFDRPDVALKQAASFFEKAQAEEIGHAKAFMKYQNTRGGKVALQRVEIPTQDFSGDASESDLCKAMSKALELEIFVYDQLLDMHKVALPCTPLHAAQAAHIIHAGSTSGNLLKARLPLLNYERRLLTSAEIRLSRTSLRSTWLSSLTPYATLVRKSRSWSVLRQAEEGTQCGTGMKRVHEQRAPSLPLHTRPRLRSAHSTSHFL